jgi:hypothetical protein
MQAISGVDNQTWMQWIEASGTRAQNPDYDYGHGIPDFWWVMQKNTPRYQLPNFQIQTIYPNPASTLLNVVTAGSPIYGWEVSDLTGRVLTSCNFESSWTRNYLQLDVNGLPAGMYHFTLFSQEGKSTTVFQKVAE